MHLPTSQVNPSCERAVHCQEWLRRCQIRNHWSVLRDVEYAPDEVRSSLEGICSGGAIATGQRNASPRCERIGESRCVRFGVVDYLLIESRCPSAYQGTTRWEHID